MIKSMTGYGSAAETVEGREISAEIKSVNHRYFEYSARVPRAFAFAEERLKSYTQSRVSRGKVELSVRVVNVSAADTVVTVNIPVAKNYLDALTDMSEQLGIECDVTASRLAKFTDIFSVKRTEEDEEKMLAEIQSVVAKAIDGFDGMRLREGMRMASDIEQKLEKIEALVSEVEKESPLRIAAYRERLTAKINEVLADRNIDEGRVLQEAAIFADRVAVDEETVRLRSHISQFRAFLKADEPIGRKMDFLTQEINREVNTIGSKAQDLKITGVVVELKSEIEKIREQIQNIE